MCVSFYQSLGEMVTVEPPSGVLQPGQVACCLLVVQTASLPLLLDRNLSCMLAYRQPRMKQHGLFGVFYEYVFCNRCCMGVF